MKRLGLALVLAGALALSTSACSSMVYTHDVPNLVEVDPGVWRSGQPRSAAGWAYLKSLGITRVVKLNFETEDSESLARAAGLEVVYLPIEPDENLGHVLDRPNQSNIDAAVRELAKGGGVVAKCRHGQDRTSLVIGEYRVRVDHWSKSRARREMKERGFHAELVGLDDAWEDFTP